MGIGIWQLAIVLVIVLLLFGTKRLRNLGGDLGAAIKGFRSAVKDGEEKPQESLDDDGEGSTIEGEVSSKQSEKTK